MSAEAPAPAPEAPPQGMPPEVTMYRPALANLVKPGTAPSSWSS